MAAAFRMGADVVELDVHLTRDGRFAVFHDWTLECRTDGAGVTRESDWEELKSLDVGYGYTRDGGGSFPFRGTGVGMMPNLREVFEAFPDGKFLIDIKSNVASDGDGLVRFFRDNPNWLNKVWGVYGGPVPVERFSDVYPDIPTFTAGSVVNCLKDYLMTGWTGRIPESCTGTTVYIPVNFAPILWGWPDRFLWRMENAGTTVVLIGPHTWGNTGTRGFDDTVLLEKIPRTYTGYIQTDRIELLGPALRN